LDVWLWLFGGDATPNPLPVHQAIARAVVVYGAGVVVLRLGKIRLLGRASVLDILLAFCVGSILSRAVNGSSTFSASVAATAAMVAMHHALSALGLRHHRLGGWIKGVSVPLVREGKQLPANMKRCGISDHDLVEELRLNGNVDDLERVEAAYLERNGEISVVRSV